LSAGHGEAGPLTFRPRSGVCSARGPSPTRQSVTRLASIEAFQFKPTAEVDGRKIKGRAHFVFCSMQNEHVAPMVWPQPNPGAPGDERT
jgi:hypothetical protein